MQEMVRSAGVRAIMQQLCRSREQVVSFFNSLPPASPGRGRCVVKPNSSAGTDSVYLCSTQDEALTAFEAIHSHVNGLGHVNDGALCQEFLHGTEYVLDGVCRDGELSLLTTSRCDLTLVSLTGVYKVIAIWKYDKRSVNDANFVYFGMRLCDSSGKAEQTMIAYAERVVLALGILHGPSHMEIMFDSALGPCLVEVKPVTLTLTMILTITITITGRIALSWRRRKLVASRQGMRWLHST